MEGGQGQEIEEDQDRGKEVPGGTEVEEEVGAAGIEIGGGGTGTIRPGTWRTR